MNRVAVVIPCFRVRKYILDVIAGIGDEVSKIFVVDDACPEKSGDYVCAQCRDPRIEVIYHTENLGVGGAVMSGYQKAIQDNFDIVIKIDGDGQMDCAQIKHFIDPIASGNADYTKGNRFYNPYFLNRMPRIRLIGNAILSLITKLSSGYWDIFDPTNGFTAISVPVLKKIPLDRISKRYFFESDMLFRLNIIRAVVIDIPIDAQYNDEESSLIISRNIWPFLKGNIHNLIKRIGYNYYLRNFSLASLQLAIGLVLALFGTLYGLAHWETSISTSQPATAGTVMVAALPIIVGFQLLMSFINYDINTVPKRPISNALR